MAGKIGELQHWLSREKYQDIKKILWILRMLSASSCTHNTARTINLMLELQEYKGYLRDFDGHIYW